MREWCQWLIVDTQAWVHNKCASGGMVDTLDSGSSFSNDVEVRVLSRVPN